MRKKNMISWPHLLLLKFSQKGLLNVQDEWFIKKQYSYIMGKELNLDSPRTFNEKLQWLKLYDRNPNYTKLVDKAEVKKIIAAVIGDKYIIPTIGVYDSFDDIDFDKLPNRFVIKCTHDSGGVVLVRDKKRIDWNKVKNDLNKALNKNYYYMAREWPYKDARPRIIIEDYVEDGDIQDVKDYKFFCFNGKPRICLVCSDRQSDLKETWFDIDFNKIDLKEGGHRTDNSIEMPDNYKTMVNLSKKIAKDIAFVRVDFYNVNGKVYFGEVTFYPAAGFERFDPPEWDRKLGDMIDLSGVKKNDN